MAPQKGFKNMMTAKDIIHHATIDAHITMTYIAKNMNMSLSSFSNRLTTGKFTIDEWIEMNKIVGNNIVLKYITIAIS